MYLSDYEVFKGAVIRVDIGAKKYAISLLIWDGIMKITQVCGGEGGC